MDAQTHGLDKESQMMKIMAVLFLMIPFVLNAGQYEYNVKFDTGKEVQNIGAVWTVQKDTEGLIMHEVTANLTQTVKCGVKGAAYEWEMKTVTAEGKKVDLKAVRKDNKINVTGIMKDEKYFVVLDIDDRPWYQALDMQLKYFLDSDYKDIEFWMVGMRPDLEAFTMSFKKSTVETLKVMGKDTDCQKLEWRATGFWSVFWSADYWFRKSDGIAVKFSMPSGNNPKATSELIKQK